MLSFDDYESLGFGLAGKAEFPRLLAAATAALLRFTDGRVQLERLDDMGRFGLCELIDLFAVESRGAAVTAFTNEGYSERYSEADKRTVAEKAEDIVALYFGRDFVFRGVKSACGSSCGSSCGSTCGSSCGSSCGKAAAECL